MSELKQTFGEHLEVLRRTIFRILIAVVVIASLSFCFKEPLFSIIFAPCNSDFPTFRLIRQIMNHTSSNSFFNKDFSLIATDISSPFMTHVTLSIYVGLLLASPYILYELMKFLSPALYDKEKKYACSIMVSTYLLFILGIVVSYYLLFPLSCRFLVTYKISPFVTTMPTLSSYMSLFLTLSMVMGLIFELPVICYILGKLDLINNEIMCNYRRHAIVLIMIIAAIITPQDIVSMIIVALPLYLLYEISIKIVKQAT